LVDANVSYRGKARLFGHNAELNFQLNINNLLNQDAIIPTRLYDDGGLRTYRFQSVRDWFLTSTARF